MGCGASTPIDSNDKRPERDMTKTPGGGPLRSSNREADDPTIPSHNYTAAWSEAGDDMATLGDGHEGNNASQRLSSPASPRHHSSVHSIRATKQWRRAGEDASDSSDSEATHVSEQLFHSGGGRKASVSSQRSQGNVHVPPLSNRKTVSKDLNSPIITRAYAIGEEGPTDEIMCITPDQSTKELDRIP